VGTVLVDTNVLIDYLDDESEWFDWSSAMLAQVADSGTVAINAIIYSELSVAYRRIEDVEDALPHSYFLRLHVPWEAAFLAAQVFREYRRHGGKRTKTLPDFYIGAHALVSNMTLLTRNARRYRQYFPKLRIISP
jgi:predicted nucleic acid-binding protein